jgi:hypothetical protein
MKQLIKEELPPAQQLPVKKDLWALIEQGNPLVLIPIGIVLLLLIVLITALISFTVFNKAPKVSNPQANSNGVARVSSNNAVGVNRLPTPTPTPRPFPTGPQTYTVSTMGSTPAIQVKQLLVSSLNTKIGEPVTISLTIQDSKSNVTSVVGNLISDKKSESKTLSLTSGTGSDGTWQGTWTTNDTHYNNYQVQITIKDTAGNTFSFTPNFR